MLFKSRVFAQVLALVVGMSVPVLASAEGEGARILVIGEGRVASQPDQAVISLGARHVAAGASEALEKTGQVSGAILSRLAELGLAEEDVQTSSINLGPVWSDADTRKVDGPPVPVGFEASTRIQVTVRDLDRLGEILDQVAGDGANMFSGFSFGLQDPGPVVDQARRLAIADARRKAALYADAAGVTLGEVLMITEELGGDSYPMPMMEASVRSGRMPIARGEVTNTAQIKMIFSVGN